MPTTTELNTRILKRIGVLDTAENQTAAEDDDCLNVLNSIYDGLKERGYIHWTLTSIPAMFQEPFITYVGFYVQPHFGVAASNPVTEMDRRQALRDIVSLSAVKSDPRSRPSVNY